MPTRRSLFRNPIVVVLLVFLGLAPWARADSGPAIMDRFATVNGVKLHYLVAGKGAPVILLHGYAQNSHMWRPLMKELAKTHLVIAPDLRGFGDSDEGRERLRQEDDGAGRARAGPVARHREGRRGRARHRPDGGLRLCRAVSGRGRPHRADGCVHPGVGDTTNLFLLKDLWHFHFYGPTPLALVKGRERIYFEHFWNDFAADGTKSVSEADRRFYAQKYAQPGAMKAGMEVFRNFDQDAKDNAAFATTKLTMPMLVLGGEKSGGDFLITQGKMVATNVEGVLVIGSGHWLIDEAPGQVIPKLVEFFGR